MYIFDHFIQLCSTDHFHQDNFQESAEKKPNNSMRQLFSFPSERKTLEYFVW